MAATLGEIRTFIRSALNVPDQEHVSDELLSDLVGAARQDVVTSRDWPFLRKMHTIPLERAAGLADAGGVTTSSLDATFGVRRVETVLVESEVERRQLSHTAHTDALGRSVWDAAAPVWWSEDLQGSDWRVYVWPWSGLPERVTVQVILDPAPLPDKSPASKVLDVADTMGRSLSPLPPLMVDAIRFSATALAADFLGDDRAQAHGRTAARLRRTYAESVFPTASALFSVGGGGSGVPAAAGRGGWVYTPFRYP